MLLIIRITYLIQMYIYIYIPASCRSFVFVVPMGIHGFANQDAVYWASVLSFDNDLYFEVKASLLKLDPDSISTKLRDCGATSCSKPLRACWGTAATPEPQPKQRLRGSVGDPTKRNSK